MNKRGARHDPCGTQRFKFKHYGGIHWWRPADLCYWPSMTWTIPRQLCISQTPYPDMSVVCCNWLYQKRRWDQVWPAKSPLECLFSWEYLSWLWQGPFPCYDFDDMMTEPRGIYIVNDLSYGCVFVQAAFLVSLEIYCKLLTGLQFLGGLAQASSIVKARAHTSSHQRTTQTLVIN